MQIQQGARDERRSGAQTGLENVEFLELLLHYKKTRSRTLRICSPLETEDAQIQSIPDVSPPKWHLAHTTWFFENFVLQPLFRGYEVFHPRFHYLFNSYYKSQGEHYPRERRGMLSRPTLGEILRYREWVDSQVFRLLSSDGSEMPDGVDWRQIRERITLGLHHEEQHQELLLTDIKNILGSNPLRPFYQAAMAVAEPLPKNVEYLEFQGGMQRLGWDSDGFCFDNERPAHPVYLQPFRLASRPVSNGEYLEFIEDGGYKNPLLWLSDGWDLRCREDWQHPMYWERCARSGDLWQVYGFSGMQDLRRDEPVCHLSYYEADAYARWKGARLPTEGEWECAVRSERLRLFAVGAVWEWTSSAYLPYPGFRPFGGAFGEYNGKFMSGQMVLRGGSVASPPGHVRHSYRNFFPPTARWQFSGVRLAQ